MFAMTPWVTRLLMANVVMFFLTMVLGGLPNILVLVPALVWRQPWTAFTYMFLHAGMGHIFFNMLFLFFFGPRLEAKLGGKRFISLYLASGLTGALLSVLTPWVAIVGASGAVYGVLFGFAYFWPREKIYIWGILPVEARVLVTFAVVLSLWAGYQGGGGVAHFAHLGGFLGAFLYLKISERWTPAARWKRATAPPQPKRQESGERSLLRWRKIEGEELHPLNREELNRILDKISSGGVTSLTKAEQAFLERFSSQGN
jgi:membrane associated rhomboid family serine protease